MINFIHDWREKRERHRKAERAKQAREARKEIKFCLEVKQNLQIAVALGKTYLRHFFVWLTQFPPFSLLSNFTWMNYENREAFQSRCAIRDTGFLAGIYFEVEEFYKDDNFVFFEGKFDKVIKGASGKTFMRGLGKIYGEENIYLSETERGMKLIKITREAALNRPYYSFLAEKRG